MHAWDNQQRLKFTIGRWCVHIQSENPIGKLKRICEMASLRQQDNKAFLISMEAILNISVYCLFVFFIQVAVHMCCVLMCIRHISIRSPAARCAVYHHGGRTNDVLHYNTNLFAAGCYIEYRQQLGFSECQTIRIESIHQFDSNTANFVVGLSKFGGDRHGQLCGCDYLIGDRFHLCIQIENIEFERKQTVDNPIFSICFGTGTPIYRFIGERHHRNRRNGIQWFE